MSAVRDLTACACEGMHEKMPNHPAVYYQSVGSQMNCASSGRFPLNMAYPLVRHFDGANDGLVSAESAQFGDCFTMLTTGKGRGISHGDMIDLNRENIPGFYVREFYVNLVKNLKEKGILVNQRKARASAAYRTTQSAGRRKSIWASDNTGIQ